MKPRFAELLTVLTGAGLALFLVIGTTSGEFSALMERVANDAGLSPVTT